MSHNIWSVFSYELRRNFRRRGFLFTTFGIPLIGFLIITGIQIFSGSSANEAAKLEFDLGGIKAAGYVDLSGEFPQPGQYVEGVMTRYDTREAAQAALDAGEIEVYYVIAGDYLETGDVMLVVP